jgi:hypothetical protein
MSRVQRHEIPPALRAAIEGVLGEPVAAAHSQSGGYPPGVGRPRRHRVRQASVTLDRVRERGEG